MKIDFMRWIKEEKRTDEGRPIRSKDHLGKIIFREWEKRDPQPPTSQARSISAKLGHLENGKGEWWQGKGKVALEILAELLERDIADFGLQPPGIPPSRLFEFAGFPQLRPFDPLKESPCDLATLTTFSLKHTQDELLFPATHAQHNLFGLHEEPAGATWIVMPPGAGKSFVLHWHRVRFERLLTVPIHSLADLANTVSHADLQSKTTFLLLEVETRSSSDSTVIKELATRGRVAVLAPFAHPLLNSQQNHPSDETASEQSVITDIPQQSQLLSETAPSAPESQWHNLHWTPRKNWQQRFVEWVAARTTEATFAPDKLLTNLARMGFLRQNFATPGDLLPLLALAHKEGERTFEQFQERKFAIQWLNHHINTMPQETSNYFFWIQSQGRDVLPYLAEQRWQSLDCPWRSSLPKEQWIRWMEQYDFSPDTPHEELCELVDKIVDQPQHLERQESAEQFKTKLEPRSSPEIAFQYLCTAGFLRERSENRWAVYPNWLMPWLMQAKISRLLETEKTHHWGVWWIERERRPMLDQAIDRLQSKKFDSLIQKALDEWTPDNLGSVGAIEALFAAVGRRLQKKEPWKGNKTLLHQLWQAQSQTFCTRDPSPYNQLSPLLRDALREPDWLADAWAWSFFVPPPPTAPPHTIRLFFPGWCDHFSLAQLPQHYFNALRFHEGMEYIWPEAWYQQQPDPDTLDYQVWRIIQMVPKFLDRCVDKKIPGYLSLAVCLLPEMIFRSVQSTEQEQWHLGEYAGLVLNTSWLTLYLVKEINPLSAQEKQKIASYLFREILAGDKTKTLGFFSWLESTPVIAPLFYEHLPEEVVCKALQQESVPPDLHLDRKLSTMPKRLWSTFLVWGLNQQDEQKRKNYIHFMGFAARGLSSEESEFMWAALEYDPENWQLMGRLWEVDPDNARKKTEEMFLQDPSSNQAHLWFGSARESEIAFQIGLLERQESLCVGCEWIAYWLAHRIGKFPVFAKRMYRLLRKIQQT